MANECLNIPLDSHLYKSVLKKITLLRLYYFGAELGVGQKIGLAFYKIITFFQTKYKNQHEFVILEGKNQDNEKIFLLTELCSFGSGNYTEISRYGYLLFISKSMDSLLEFTEQKNPKVIKEYSVKIKGDTVLKYVQEQTEIYSSIGNNCQDYAERFVKFVLQSTISDNEFSKRMSIELDRSHEKISEKQMKEYKSQENIFSKKPNLKNKPSKTILEEAIENKEISQFNDKLINSHDEKFKLKKILTKHRIINQQIFKGEKIEMDSNVLYMKIPKNFRDDLKRDRSQNDLIKVNQYKFEEFVLPDNQNLQEIKYENKNLHNIKNKILKNCNKSNVQFVAVNKENDNHKKIQLPLSQRINDGDGKEVNQEVYSHRNPMRFGKKLKLPKIDKLRFRQNLPKSQEL